MAILLVRVEAPESGTEREAYLDFDFVKNNSCLLQHVHQLAYELLDGFSEISASYMDNAGNTCVLTEQNANDALSSAAPEGPDGMRALKLTIQEQQAQETAAVVPVITTEAQQDHTEKELAKEIAQESDTEKENDDVKESANEDTEMTKLSPEALVEEACSEAGKAMKVKEHRSSPRPSFWTRIFGQGPQNAKEEAEQTKEDDPKQDMPRPSAFVQSCSPLFLAVEAMEDVEMPSGDATSALPELVSGGRASQAFRIGRVHLPAASAGAPISTKVSVQNDGISAWPSTTALVSVEGDSMGLPSLKLGSLEPAEVTEFEMDLEVCALPDVALPDAEMRSIWAIVDAETGLRLGPLIIFEAIWDLA